MPAAVRRGITKGGGGARAWSSRGKRSRPLKRADNRGARRGLRPLCQEDGGGVEHLDQPVGAHLEDPDLVGGAEAVLRRPQDPVGVVTVPFTVEDRVDEVL